MVGSVTSSSARSSHSVDRFYYPPQKRQQQQLQQQQQQQRPQRPPQRRAREPAELRECENRPEADGSSSTLFVLPPRLPGSNLDRFVHSTTPIVKLRHFQKRGRRDARNLDAAYVYFNLSDVCDAYVEWSAYGAGVPLVLNEVDEVVQYYVPYLSGMQLYARDNNARPLRARHLGDNSDGELYRDTSSEGSADCGVDWRSDRFCESAGRQQMIDHVNRLTLGDEGHGALEIPNANDTDSGVLVFEYLERDSPYARQPLADKLKSLVSQFPDLKAYKSSALLPESWLSVAWYPIYRIPTGPTLKDLDSCFLTFHSLALPFKGLRNGHVDLGSSAVRKSSNAPDFSFRLPLPAFGLASYKFKDSIWYPDRIEEQQQAASLMQAAGDWLTKIKVELPDYKFFTSHGNYRR